MKFEEKTLESKTIYTGNITEYEIQTVELTNGKKAIREIVWHDDAAAVLAIEDGKMIFVKQYRKPIEKISVELPCGLVEENEKPIDAANREFEEETGYTAKKLNYLTSFYNSPGFTNEKLYIYEATEIEKVDQPLEQDPDEMIELLKLTYDDAWNYMKQGYISDSKTVFALYYWKQKKAGEQDV